MKSNLIYILFTLLFMVSCSSSNEPIEEIITEDTSVFQCDSAIYNRDNTITLVWSGKLNKCHAKYVIYDNDGYYVFSRAQMFHENNNIIRDLPYLKENEYTFYIYMYNIILKNDIYHSPVEMTCKIHIYKKKDL